MSIFMTVPKGAGLPHVTSCSSPPGNGPCSSPGNGPAETLTRPLHRHQADLGLSILGLSILGLSILGLSVRDSRLYMCSPKSHSFEIKSKSLRKCVLLKKYITAMIPSPLWWKSVSMKYKCQTFVSIFFYCFIYIFWEVFKMCVAFL